MWKKQSDWFKERTVCNQSTKHFSKKNSSCFSVSFDEKSLKPIQKKKKNLEGRWDSMDGKGRERGQWKCLDDYPTNVCIIY